MTREEAVARIKDHIEIHRYHERNAVKIFEALDMAIKALEQHEIIHCRDCKYYIPYEWMFDGIPRSSDIADYAPDEIGCSINDHNYQPDGFCSYAERREE